MLNKITDITQLEILSKKFANYFTETWDYTINELQEPNITVLATDDLTYCSILREEQDYLHYDFSLLDEELRGKGFGTSMILEILEYFKESPKVIRATVRLNNYASYKSLLKTGFVQNETSIVGSDLGVEMIYIYSKINISKYISRKSSSCGLTVLSALSDLKDKVYINPDEILIPCIKNKGIPKELMRQYLVTKYINIKQISNFSLSSEQAFHLIENHLTKVNSFVICDIGKDLIWEHWVLVYKFQDGFFYIIDSESMINKVPRLKFYDQLLQTNFFSFLL